MASSTNTMQITAQGLLKISRELINKRVYDASKITVIGSPVVSIGGEATGFAEDSYFQYTNLSFQDRDVVRIHFEGNFALGDDTGSCAYSLHSSETGYFPLSVVFSSTKISFCKNGVEVLALSNILIEDNSKVSLDLSLDYASCSLSLLYKGITTSAVGSIDVPLELSKYTSVIIGNSEPSGDIFWKGGINLPEFSIVQNNVLTYSPSKENIFNFTKLLVSDGVYPLMNGSSPLINHVYEFPITELKRSGGNILIMTTIDSKTHLTIKQLGLYSTVDGEDQLFSLIDNLNIKKGKDIGYDIIFNINVDLEVVNTNLYPTIILTEQIPVRYKDLLTVKNVHANDVTDMERAVKKNSTELGYNSAQTYCRLQDKISLWESNCTGVSAFGKAKEKYKYFDWKVFQPESVITTGGVSLTSDGILSDFSSTKYATVYGSSVSDSTWSFKFSLTTGHSLVNKEGVLITNQIGTYKPLEVYIQNEKVHVKLAQREELKVSDGTSILTYYRTQSTEVNDDTTYYKWEASDSTYTHFNILTTSVTPSSGDTIYDSTFAAITTLSFSSISNGYIVSDGNFSIEALTEYFILLDYDGTEYKMSYSTDGISYTTFATQTSSLIVDSITNILFGVSLNGSSVELPFDGSFNLMNFELAKPNNSIVLYLVEKMETELLDFFHIPDYKYSAYSANNLNYENSKLTFIEGLMNGKGDHINFGNAKGFTLSLKVNLKDGANKTIIAKADLTNNNNLYLKVEQSQTSLKFTLFLNTGSVVLEKGLNIRNLREYTDNPILLSIIRDSNSYSPSYAMYKNNTLIASVRDTSTDFQNATSFPNIVNYTSAEEAETAANYLMDIYTFSGPLTEEQLYYLTNLTDTNFS